MKPLTRLRLQLTAWYGATFALIVFALGALILVAITRNMSSDLESSLSAATREVARATATREVEAVAAGGRAVDALDELRIPDRALYLFDTSGHSLVRRDGDTLLVAIARSAAHTGSASAEMDFPHDRTLQAHAERFTTPAGHAYVAVAAADRVELEDRYAQLIATFAVAAFASLLLIAAGGWLVAGVATRPVERNVEHMRRFMADAAHELRTPIAVLRSRADVTLQQDRARAEYTDAISRMRREAEALGAVVEDLLTLSRADAGERPLAREPLDLADVVIDAVASASSIADRRGVRLAIGLADEAEAFADPALIRQLVMILLDNALKFTAAGGTVDVDVRAAGDESVIAVRDSGVGIAADELPRVFDRFFRGSDARHHGTGAGLGLSIARWITDAHGARLAVQSVQGEGTTVSATFPRNARRTSKL
ncbi:MAG: HAMP domain-containing sensor histidine kinase [Gemmatimonadaceae bacterium]